MPDHFCHDRRLKKLKFATNLELFAAQFDRLGESELYRVDGGDGRVEDMTGRTFNTDDLFGQDDRKGDPAEEVTFRTDQAIIAG